MSCSVAAAAAVDPVFSAACLHALGFAIIGVVVYVGAVLVVEPVAALPVLVLPVELDDRRLDDPPPLLPLDPLP